MVYNVRSIKYKDGVVDTRIYSRALENERKRLKGYIAKCKREKSDVAKEDDRRRSANRCKNVIYQLARNQKWDYFVTLTLDSKKIDRYNYDILQKKMTSWLRNLRRVAPDMIYLFVPEHHKDGAYHFHGLIGRCGNIRFVDSGHKDHKGRSIYNIGNYRFGWSTATPVTDNESVIRYISKYITKELITDTIGKKHYWASRNLDRPAEVLSYEDEFGKCALWQELGETAISYSEVKNQFQGVMYIRSNPSSLNIEDISFES